MKIKREIKRTLFNWVLLIISGIFLIFLVAWDIVGIVPRKLLLVSLTVLLVHFLRKLLFPYFDVEKSFIEAKEIRKDIAFLGLAVILGAFILGLFIAFAFLQ